MNKTLFGCCVVGASLSISLITTLSVLRYHTPRLSEPTLQLEEMLYDSYASLSPVTINLVAETTRDDVKYTSRAGTGIIVESRGTILTSKHLIGEDLSYTVTLEDGTKLPAKLLKTHPTLDLALLEIISKKPLSLPVGKFIASQATLRRGDIVVALSNALGLYPHTLSQGIITGIDRTVSLGDQTMTGLLQTSIPLSIGSSGGPLVRRDGIIIGINTGIVGGSSQIGWTLPLTQEEVDDFLE